MWQSEITGMTTVMTYGNYDTNKPEGYYYQYYRATKGTDYVLDFKIVIKVGNPISGYQPSREHMTYSYSSDWLDQMTGYQLKTYSSSGSLLSTTGQTYTFDEQGNPTTIYDFVYEDTTYHHAYLEYDGRQLAKIKIYDGATSYDLVYTLDYVYNDQGYRTNKTITHTNYVGYMDVLSTQEIEYTLQGDKVIYETDGVYGIMFSYDYDGTIISFNYDSNIDDGYSGTEYYYIRNLQGDITKIVDNSGTILVEYTYDAWGNIISIIDNSSNNLSTINPYTYRGYRYDSEIGLYYLNSRFYNPNTGRFINGDGLLGEPGDILGHNIYAYTCNSPITRVDFDGTFWNLVAGAVIGGIVGGVASVITQLIDGEGIDLRLLGVSMFTGAVSGALAASGVGIVGSIFGNGLLSGGEELVSQLITNGFNMEELNFGNIGLSTLSGAIGGGLSGEGFLNSKSIKRLRKLERFKHLNTSMSSKYLGNRITLLTNNIGKSLVKDFTVTTGKYFFGTFIDNSIEIIGRKIG